MCNIDHNDNCQNAAAAERELITELLQELLTTNRKKLTTTTGEARSIRLLGTIIGLEDAIKLIESLD
jgi:predicted DNA-binding protein (UPF0251 family)